MITAAATQAAPGAHAAAGGKRAFLGLALGSVGVVFGDIGTSPLYAMREALAHSRGGGAQADAVLGVISLVIWALTLIVTVKYVIFLMRADNRGEGGTLALMALAQRALGRHSIPIFFLGMVGASLFYGDGIITPAISVLSAVEGVRGAPGVGHLLAPYVIPVACGILIALFLVQAKGTHRVATLFGPITVVWFLVLGGLGLLHLADDLSVFRAINPYYGARFILENGFLGFVILGSVFLAVTGAEALYLDMGHFGRGPIRFAWVALVFPCLTLNYLGQGAVVLHNPGARHNPFWAMAPTLAYWPILLLATVATVIASQAVISGAFSMTRQAVQLGLFPRMSIRRTSETQAGQIYVPFVNSALMVGVLVLVIAFHTSSRLASAYGIAVTGSMFVDTLLAYVVVRRLWRWSLPRTAALLAPLMLVDATFISSNLLKIPDGAWFPLTLGATFVVVMWTWTRGSRVVMDKIRSDSLPLADLIKMLAKRPVTRAPATAVFLTSDPEMAPLALLHNLKHNMILHRDNILLTVKTSDTPRVSDEERVAIETISPDFKKVTVTYGFMESPNVPKALRLCRQRGLKFDIMATSFFLGRRSLVPDARSSAMPLWQDRLFIFLVKNGTNPTDFFHIPANRVVEMGAQVTV